MITIGEIIREVREAYLKFADLSENRNLYEAVEKILRVKGKKIEDFDGSVKNILDFLENVEVISDDDKDKTVEELEGPEKDGEFEARSLNKQELEILIEKYEKSLAENKIVEAKSIEEQLGKGGINVKQFLGRQEEIYRDGLKNIVVDKGNKEIKKEMAQDLAINEAIVRRNVEKSITSPMNEITAKITEILVKEISDKEVNKNEEIRGLNLPEEVRTYIENNIIENKAEILVNTKVKMGVSSLVHQLRDSGIKLEQVAESELKNELEKNILDKFETNSGVEDKEITEIVRNKIGSDDFQNEVETITKERIVELQNFKDNNPEPACQYSWNRTEEKIKDELQKEDGKDADQYVGFVKEIIGPKATSKIEQYKTEAFDFSVNTRGNPIAKIEEGWGYLKGFYGLLNSGQKVENVLKKYNSLKIVKDGKVPFGKGDLRAIDGLMKWFGGEDGKSNQKLFNFIQTKIRFLDKFNNLEYKVLSKFGGEKTVVWLGGKIGGQAGIEFAKQGLTILAEKGIGTGLKEITFQLVAKTGLDAGIKAVGTKIAQSAIGKTLIPLIVEGLAAIGITIGSGGTAAIVFAVILVAQLVWEVAKFGGRLVRDTLGYLGINLPDLKSKLEQKFGKVGGFVGGLANTAMEVMVGSLMVGVGAIITGISAGIAAISISMAPFIIGFLVIFIFIPLLAGGLISTQVDLGGRGGGTPSGMPSGGPIIPPGSCDLRSKLVLNKQCGQSYSEMALSSVVCDGENPTICSHGCGPACVSMVLGKTPDQLITDYVPYVQCYGTSQYNHQSVLVKYLGNDAVIFDSATMGCDENYIKEQICVGNVVLIGATYCSNSSCSSTTDHFVLGVAVDSSDNQIVTYDPYIFSEKPFSGGDRTGKIKNIHPAGCLLIKSDKI